MAARRLGRAVLSLNRKVISVDVFNHLLRSARAEEGWVHLSALVQLVFFFFLQGENPSPPAARQIVALLFLVSLNCSSP